MLRPSCSPLPHRACPPRRSPRRSRPVCRRGRSPRSPPRPRRITTPPPGATKSMRTVRGCMPRCRRHRPRPRRPDRSPRRKVSRDKRHHPCHRPRTLAPCQRHAWLKSYLTRDTTFHPVAQRYRGSRAKADLFVSITPPLHNPESSVRPCGLSLAAVSQAARWLRTRKTLRPRRRRAPQTRNTLAPSADCPERHDESSEYIAAMLTGLNRLGRRTIVVGARELRRFCFAGSAVDVVETPSSPTRRGAQAQRPRHRLNWLGRSSCVNSISPAAPPSLG